MSNALEDQEDAPLLGETDLKPISRNENTNRQPFNDDDKPSDINNDGMTMDHKGSTIASSKTDPDTHTGRSTSRFRKNKPQREAKGSRDDDKLSGDSNRGNEQNNNPEHDNDDEQDMNADEAVDKEKETPPLKTRNDNCCMPVAGCLSSCFSGMGLGFRKSGRGLHGESTSTNTGRTVDTRMWEFIQKSIAFRNIATSAFCINIGRLSDLQGVLGSAVKPFIKVHIVDIDTGHYILPDSTGKVSVSRSAPLLTRQASLKGTSSDIAQWDEEICFPNISFKDVVSPQNLILFEVLDDPPSLSFRKAQTINSTKDMGTRSRTYTTLAWAFLLPVGQQVNVGYPRTKKKHTSEDVDPRHPATYDMSLRLQLYRYKVDTVVTRLQRVANRWPAAESSQQKRKKTESLHRYPDNIPEVFFQYKRKSQELLTSVLEIASGCRPPALLPNVEQGGVVMDTGGDTQQQDLDPRSSQAQEDIVKAQLRAAKLKRSRALNEPCVIPNKLLHRVDAGPEGGMVVSFSHKGHLLAIAGAAPGGGSAGSSSVPFAPVGGTSPYAHLSYSVRLFDPDTGVEIWSELFAHFGVIYDIKWSLADTYFVTCSSDGCCKVWRFVGGVNDDVLATSGGNGGNSSPTRRASLQAKQHRRRSSMAGIGIQATVAISAFQDLPVLVATLAHNPPVYVYAAIFQEYASASAHNNSSQMPQIITGAADGRIRVWKGTNLVGDLTVTEGEGMRKSASSTSGRSRRGSIRETDIDTADRVECHEVPHYGGKVQALAIDIRSKYMFSGDSRGEILIWRPNNSGWYQLLRKLRKDDLFGRSISSLSVYPDRAKGYLLVLGLPSLVDAPSTVTSSPFHHGRDTAGEQGAPGKVLTSPLLKLYDLGTYRAQHSFPGVVINNSFCRANFSADGRYATCGTILRTHEGAEKNHIRMWDTLTGRHVDTKIASLPYSYIPRSVAWHPKQHMLAVAMVGQGAAVSIYCANKARNEEVVHGNYDSRNNMTNTNNTNNNFNNTAGSDGALMKSEAKPTIPNSSSLGLLSPGRLRKFRNKTAGDRERRGDRGGAAGGAAAGGIEGGEDSLEVRTKEQRAARTREILDKIKAAKARAKGEQQQ